MSRMKALVAVAVLGLALGSAVAKETKKPDATLTLHAGSVAAGLGISWGSGTLTYRGKQYPVDVKGLSVGDVGVSKIEATGKGYGLKKLEEFDGNYTGVGTGAAVAGGGGVAKLQNQNGVTVDVVATTQGIKFALGGAGVDMHIEK